MSFLTKLWLKCVNEGNHVPITGFQTCYKLHGHDNFTSYYRKKLSFFLNSENNFNMLLNNSYIDNLKIILKMHYYQI